ncbi:SDR family oxidoreductase [Pontivivens insulae]|uniref:3-oxoacyl-[acyl-carrier-protein] reductase FabG n=1 Tax=Pontivivens insulae TaxID=1639689 RepID=A0A2R8AC69_9RHOB|nr:SDR family oxidoreductase [Pontivivens insulae]RED13745.1 NAD(P)-dependent dehydrogenase (short-subunit alcohol dehydrogenase family) [Pontivivens insulae]SPF29819.1 3-oxoacyl-[acyl-carrier-protein] reductase FabG [Pontivivens insulae]
MPSMLITGASAGIGAEIAIYAARAGYDIGVGFRSDDDGAEATAEQIRKAGQRAELLRGDCAIAADVAGIFAAHISAFGLPDVVVNNAGIVPPRGRSLVDATVEEIDRVLAVNTNGAVYVAREAARHMSTSRGGKGGVIVNISSAAARLGSAGEYVDYAASKAAVDTLTIGLGHELATEGVRVVGVRPGIIETGIHAKGGRPDRIEAIAPRVPLRRAGTTSEIAATVLFLASEAGSYITATSIDVSGGR